MILRNLKSLIRRYPVAVVLNFTGLVAALLAFADDIIGSSAHIEAGCTIMPFLGEIYYSVAED